MVRIPDQGISDEEAEILEERLPPMLNEHINIPIIGEKTEEDLIESFLDIIIDALRPNKSIKTEN